MQPNTTLTFRFKQHEWQLGERPKIMGILNTTPDSFSDGGNFYKPDSAIKQALAMVAGGADIIDIGGESTRPGAEPVDAATETARVLPVIEALHRDKPGIPLSIDTRKPEVATAALEAGADIINDVSGFREPEMIRTAARHQAGCVLMHMRGTPANMQQFTTYDNLIDDICTFFRDRQQACESEGIDPEQIIFDPGIGFSKNATQNLELLAATGRFRHRLDRPILMGPSRKSFLGTILQKQEAKDRIWGTAAAIALCVYEGADIIRVHDVREMRETALVAAALRKRQID
ncbi:MAG: dihydropteroate synthase [Lentisphaeria bacterium]